MAVSAPQLEGDTIRFPHVDLIIGERFILSLHRGGVEFLELAKRHYKQFFLKFAQSLGFLIFELWDHLIEGCRKVFSNLENEVEAVQSRIFGDVDNQIFSRVAEVTHELLVVRKNVLADREVLQQLAVHRSSFVSETTQPFLNNLVQTLERLGSDLTVEREVLTETLTLYLGIVSHRTNRVVNRLALISVIFLPLTFLCGVYGTNFKTNMPEIEWTYGYLYFWILTLLIAGGLIILCRVKRWF